MFDVSGKGFKMFNLQTKLQRTFIEWPMSSIYGLKTILHYAFTI